MRRLLTRNGWSARAPQLGLVLLFALACSVLVKEHASLNFSHKLHAEQDVACGDCHQGMDEKTELSGDRPGHEACFECHDDEEENCAFCHLDNTPGAERKVPRHQTEGLVFSHETHVEATEGDCTSCHATVADSEAPGDRRGWTHQQCMSCHRDAYREVKCSQCHADLSETGSEPFAMFNHDGDFLRRHGNLSRSEAVVCQHCHTEDQCAACHAKTNPIRASIRDRSSVDRDFVHRGDFLTRHAIEARLDRMSCFKCHESNTCSECHQKSGVARAGASFRHPTGWMDPGAATFHGRDARKKIAFCAGCHDRAEKTNCIACHRVGGVGGNPHPDREFDARASKSDMPCLMCH
jgi:hypothetical protein